MIFCIKILGVRWCLMLIMGIYPNGEYAPFVVGMVGDLCFCVQFLEGIEQNLWEIVVWRCKILPCHVYVKTYIEFFFLKMKA